MKFLLHFSLLYVIITLNKNGGGIDDETNTSQMDTSPFGPSASLPHGLPQGGGRKAPADPGRKRNPAGAGHRSHGPGGPGPGPGTAGALRR